MSVSNLFKRMGMKWVPDADSVGAPEGALLRADNLVPDQVGALAVRPGSTRIYNALAGLTVNSIRTVELADGTTTRVMGVGDSVYRNGNLLFSGATGTGDFQFGDDGYQIFMARGGTKKKYGPAPGEGNTNYSTYDWGLSKPTGIPTLAAAAILSSTVMALDGEDSPAPTCPTGGGTILNEAGSSDAVGKAKNYAGTDNEATRLQVDASTSRGFVERLFTSDQDYFTISTVEGTAQDLFDMYVKFKDPARVTKVHVVFGLDNSSTEPFTNDRFEFTFDFTKGEAVELKDTEAEGYSAYEQAVSGILNRVDPKEVQSVLTPERAKNKMKKVGNKKQPKSGPRLDPDVWGHLTVTRGQFHRFGNTAGRGWNTVRGVRIIVENQKGYTGADYTTTLCNAIFIGGGARALTGKFKCVIRGARTLDTYVELSPPSDESAEITLNHQVMTVTIPSAMKDSIGAQADQIWVYLFGGLLDTWYRFAIVGRSSLTETPEELTIPTGGNFTTDTSGPPYDDSGAARHERSRITSSSMTMPPTSAATLDLVVTINKSEITALMENVRLDPYTSGPPDDIVGIAGPWNGRMFCLTSKGYVYPSSNRSPSSFGDLQILDLTRYGDPLWIARTGNGIYVGMEKDIVLLVGSGDDAPDLTYIDLFPQPLNTGNPPIDSCFTVDGNTIIYRSADGLMVLSGSATTEFPKEGTSLLWRGQDRHGVEALDTATGRFRCTVDNDYFYLLAPEGSLTRDVIWRYSKTGGWSRLHYPSLPTILSIYTEPSGSIVVGASAGDLWEIDTGSQDQGNAIPIQLLTPISDGGNPLANKEAHDFQIHCNTGNATGTVYLYKNGSGTPEDTTYTFTTGTHTVYRHNLNAFGRFLRAQVEITGSFNSLSISSFDLSYRIRPQQSMKLDTGYILADNPSDLVWLQEVEFDANAFGNVTMELWREDVLYHTQVITVTDGVRYPYRILLPREAKAYRPRLIFYSTDSAGEGDVGFEVYGVRVRTRSSGNSPNQPQYRTVYPVGSAP